MELIFTEAEKKTNTWLDIDNENLGKLVKAGALQIKEDATGQKKILFYSTALLMCTLVIEANAKTFKTKFENLIIKDKPFGDWQVIIKRIDAKRGKING